MPGLLTLRPLASSSKTSRGNSSKSVTTSKLEKVREERAATPAPLTQLRTALVLPLNMPSAFRASHLEACPQSARPKQVADPLPEIVRARLYGYHHGFEADREACNYSSSGSEHEPSSVCLAAMVHEFMEDNTELGKCGRARCNCATGTCNGTGCYNNDEEDSKSSIGEELCAVLQGLTSCINPSERNLLSEVSKAVQAVKEDADVICKEEGVKCINGCLKRTVLKHLRAAGYNAAVCKSRWAHAGGLAGGDYDYIDVILVQQLTGRKERIIVDTDFRAQFEIARPTRQYHAVVQELPTLFVGKGDRLQQIVNLMSDAVRSSLKKRGMHLPPWRKPEYMRAKWFSSYRRTTNELVQHKRSADSSPGVDIACIAVRGTGWDSKFTHEMEAEYQKTESRPVMKEMKNGIESTRSIKGHGKRLEEEEPEGVVRGANRLRGFWSDLNPDVDVTMDNVEWQPPAVKPRSSQRPGTVAGLATILKEAGLTALKQQTSEQGQEGKSLALAI